MYSSNCVRSLVSCIERDSVACPIRGHRGDRRDGTGVAFAFHGRHQGQQPSIAAGGVLRKNREVLQCPASNPVDQDLRGPIGGFGPTPVSKPQLRVSAVTRFQIRNDRLYQSELPAAIRDLARVPAGDQDLTARASIGRLPDAGKRLAGAFTRLRSVAEAGDSPQQEQLSTTSRRLLLRKTIFYCRHNLSLVISIRGDFENRARAQLVHLSQGTPGNRSQIPIPHKGKRDRIGSRVDPALSCR